MEQEKFDSLLTVAIAYANQLASLFNLFVTVAFSSLAFAAAVKFDKNVGTPYEVYDLSISRPSFWYALVLLSFYIISFFLF